MSRLGDRVQQLESQQGKAPERVVMYFRDKAGVWRDNKTGEQMPSEAERERCGIFAIRIGSPKDFEPPL